MVKWDILYTMLCGHPPFCERDENSIKSKILHSRLVFPTKNFKNVSAEAIDYLNILFAYDPNKRPSAEETFEICWLINESVNGNIELKKRNYSKFVKI